MIVFALALLAQPALDLPPDAADDASDAALVKVGGVDVGTAVDDAELLKGLQGARLRSGHTVVGGYAQLNLNLLAVGPPEDADNDNGTGFAAPTATADVRRLVLFVAHTFTDDARFYSEFEWEHAVACRSCAGASEIEQAFVEYDVVDNADDDAAAVTVRGGLVLIPIGIINQWHEPPVFHGVDRPRGEEVVIPSTWRELGGGITGTPLPGLNYELYLTTGLNPTRFAPNGLAASRGNGAFVDASSFMVSSRLELEPLLGFLVGVSGLAGDTGGSVFGATRFRDGDGKAVKLVLPIYGGSADARVRRGGLEARALIGGFAFPNAADLMRAHLDDGSLAFLPPDSGKGAIAERMLTAQLEVAFDVLRLLPLLGGESQQQLLPFVRVDFSDTQNLVPAGFTRDPAQNVKELTVGLSWRPLQQIVVKADGQLRNRELGLDEGQLNLGLGLMF